MKKLGVSIWQTLRRALSSPLPADLDTDDEVIDAKKFLEDFELPDESDWEWVCDYAKENYEQIATIHKILDDKANEVVKYLGGATGIAGVGLIATTRADNAWVLPYLVWPFLTSILAIYLAVLARMPLPVHIPPSIKEALKVAAEYKDAKTSRGHTLGAWYLATRSHAAANRVKADRVEAANWCVLLTIILLFIAFLRVTANVPVSKEMEQDPKTTSVSAKR